MRNRLRVAVASLMLALTACSGNSASSSSATAPSSTLPPPDTRPEIATWTAGPDPCGLLPEDDAEALAGYDLTVTSRGSAIGEHQPYKGSLEICLMYHSTGTVEGGQISVAVLPPTWDYEADLELVPGAAELDGIGERAWLGRFEAGTGAGPNFGLVDMGEGGFSLSVLIFTDLTEEAMTELMRTIAANWTDAVPAQE